MGSIALFMSAMLLSSCSSTTSSGTGLVIHQASDLSPAASPGDSADLILAGTRRRVSLRFKHVGDLNRLELTTHGAVVETETYQLRDDSFRLFAAADENYSPGIELLRFPMKVGDTWNWKGSLSSGGVHRPATATIISSAEQRFEGAHPVDTVRVAVSLTIAGDRPDAPATQRRLQFWFVPQQGVFRREFGPASIREPSAPGSP